MSRAKGWYRCDIAADGDEDDDDGTIAKGTDSPDAILLREIGALQPGDGCMEEDFEVGE